MAITFDTSDVSRRLVNPGTSLTYSYTCTGSNRLLFCSCLVSAATNNITGVTYNGVSMGSAVNTIATDAGANTQVVYALLGPATGANNVVVSISPSSTVQAHSTSYAGVSQSGFPDAQTTASLSGTSQVMTLTTVADNCWLYAYHRSDTTNPGAAGTNTTVRNGATSASTVCDTNSAQTPAGSKSMTLTYSGGSGWANIVSFAPVSAATANSGFLMFMQ